MPQRENRAGQAKAKTAADVAGPASTVGVAGQTATPPETTTETVQTPVHTTAGPLGATYVTGPDGVAVPVNAPQQSAVDPDKGAAPAVAIVDVETPKDAGASLTPQGRLVAVREIVPGVASEPVYANPGPPDKEPPEGSKVAYADPDPKADE